MNILKDVLTELFGMFVADSRLSGAILAVVTTAAGLIELVHVEPLIAGGALLGGCLAVLVLAVRRSSLSQTTAALPAGDAGAAVSLSSMAFAFVPNRDRAGMLSGLAAWLDRQRQRKSLSELDAERLADIGVTREEAIEESRRLN